MELRMKKIDQFDAEWNVLSNFYYCPIEIDGVEYPTNEHAYQAFKTTDEGERKIVCEQKTPGMAKRAGRKVTLREDWETSKFYVMEVLCRQKFVTDDYCHDKLLSTGDAELIEGNTWGDTIWGVCDGKGENHLGKILMKIRDELRNDNEHG